jgi:hypothetical protein
LSTLLTSSNDLTSELKLKHDSIMLLRQFKT